MTGTPPRRVYRRPPLVEAVIEFGFRPASTHWDTVFFGKIHDLVQDRLPKIDTLAGAQIQLTPQQGLSLTAAPELKRFSSADDAWVATVGPSVLGLSVLPERRLEGHPGWNALRDAAFDLLDKYVAVAGQVEISKVGLRYINMISVDPESFRLGDIIDEASGLIAPKLLDEDRPFSYRVERIVEATPEVQHAEVVQLSAQPDGSEGGRLVLDVDQVLFAVGDRGLAEEPQQVAEKLHAAVHALFETVIRREVLDRFGPVEPAFER